MENGINERTVPLKTADVVAIIAQVTVVTVPDSRICICHRFEKGHGERQRHLIVLVYKTGDSILDLDLSPVWANSDSVTADIRSFSLYRKMIADGCGTKKREPPASEN